MQIERIDSPQRLLEIDSQWLDLLERSKAKDFFLLPQWFRAWWRVFGASGDLRAYAAWDGDRLDGLAALRLSRQGPFRTLIFAGLPLHSDRTNFLLAPGRERETARAMIEKLIADGGFDAARLDNVSPFSPAAEAMAEAFDGLGLSYSRQPCQSCHYVPLTEYQSFDDYLRKMSMRRRVRNKANRLNALGDRARWDLLDSLAPVLDEMEDLDKNRSLRSGMGLNFFQTPENKRFLAELDKEMGGSGLIKLFTLRLDGKLVSYVLHFDYADSLMAYQPAYDKSLANMSLGTLCFARAIEHAFASGRREYDFLLGDESYKDMWTRHTHPNTRFIVYGAGVGSHLLRMRDQVVKPLGRRLKAGPAGRWLAGRRAPHAQEAD